jgi:hypothetical protein
MKSQKITRRGTRRAPARAPRRMRATRDHEIDASIAISSARLQRVRHLMKDFGSFREAR